LVQFDESSSDGVGILARRRTLERPEEASLLLRVLEEHGVRSNSTFRATELLSTGCSRAC